MVFHVRNVFKDPYQVYQFADFADWEGKDIDEAMSFSIASVAAATVKSVVRPVVIDVGADSLAGVMRLNAI